MSEPMITWKILEEAFQQILEDSKVLKPAPPLCVHPIFAITALKLGYTGPMFLIGGTPDQRAEVFRLRKELIQDVNRGQDRSVDSTDQQS